MQCSGIAHKIGCQVAKPTALPVTSVVGGILSSPTTSATSRGHMLIVIEGDSISSGTNGYTSFASEWGIECKGFVTSQISAISGSKLSDVQSRATTVDGYLSSLASWRSGAILSLLVGTNDLAGYTGGLAQYLIDLAAYCDARRTAGYKVALGTLLPKGAGVGGGTSWNTLRGQFNSAVAGWVGSHIDALIDLASESIMGTQSGADNATYYYDSLHPTQLGHDLLYAIAEPVYQSLVTNVAIPSQYSAWSATDKGVGVAVSNANYTAGPNSGSGFKAIRGAVQRNAGKYYTEMLIGGSTDQLFGVVCKDASVASYFFTSPQMTIYPSTNSLAFCLGFTTVNTPDTTTFQAGNRAGIAIDFDAGKLWVSRNGVYPASGNPATGANPSFTFTPNTSLWLATSLNAGSGATLTLPKSASDLAYSIPSGFLVF